MTANEQILMGMKNARLLYAKCFAPLAQECALTQLQIDLLLFLYNNPQYDTAQRVCELRGLAKSNVSNAVEELSGRGLLLRRTDPQNRRTVHLSLTPQAAGLMQRALACQQQFFSALTRGFSPGELEQARTIFNRIHQNICANL